MTSCADDSTTTVLRYIKGTNAWNVEFGSVMLCNATAVPELGTPPSSCIETNDPSKAAKLTGVPCCRRGSKPFSSGGEYRNCSVAGGEGSINLAAVHTQSGV